MKKISFVKCYNVWVSLYDESGIAMEPECYDERFTEDQFEQVAINILEWAKDNKKIAEIYFTPVIVTKF